MLKSFIEFLMTGAMLAIGYILYFVCMFLGTFIIGLPIAFGIKFLIDIVSVFFGGASNANI
jgi:hypothetical protein